MSEPTHKRPDQHILILGCGYTGAELAQRLAFKGVPVVGTTRSDERASIIRTRGAQPLLWDGADWAPIHRWRGRVRAVVSAVPPRMLGRGDGYEDVHEALLERLAEWPLDAFVYLSSTSVYGDQGGALVDEAAACTPDSPRGRARLEIEQQVLGSGLPAMVIRPAGIYGLGRSQLHRVASGRYRVVAGGGAYTNRIHVKDLAGMIEAAITRGTPGSIYLGSDTQPATQREVTDHIVETFGLPAPVEMPLAEARVRLDRNVLAMITGSKRLDSSATLADLRLRLRFPTYVEGLADVWQRQRAQISALVGA